MTGAEKRIVGERGQVTIPKELREAFGIEGGDEVSISDQDGKIVIEKPVSREKMAEGYRRRAEQNQNLAEELRGVSKETDSYLGDGPAWEE
jgi:AbrB family looped-hinge helix DNA binding protein